MENNIKNLIESYKASLLNWGGKFLSIKKNDDTRLIIKNLIYNACESVCDNPPIYKALTCKLETLLTNPKENETTLASAEFVLNNLKAESFSQQLINLGNKQHKYIEEGNFDSFIKTENFIFEICSNIPSKITPIVKENIENKMSNFECGIETIDCTGAQCALDSLVTCRPELKVIEQDNSQN